MPPLQFAVRLAHYHSSSAVFSATVNLQREPAASTDVWCSEILRLSSPSLSRFPTRGIPTRIEDLSQLGDLIFHTWTASSPPARVPEAC